MRTLEQYECEECGKKVPMVFAKTVRDEKMRPTIRMVCVSCSRKVTDGT